MPNRKVLLHEVRVYFEDGTNTLFDANQIVVLQVQQRRLSAGGPPGPGPLVERVEFTYRAADGVDYTTTVRAGSAGSSNGADHIFVGPVQVPPSPRPPVELPAADIQPGVTFGVIEHGPKAQADMSKNLETGWHRSDCTWFYPY